MFEVGFDRVTYIFTLFYGDFPSFYSNFALGIRQQELVDSKK